MGMTSPRPLVLALFLLSTPALAAKLELEVGAGSTGSDDLSGPAITGRIGVDFLDHLTPSLRVLALSPVRGGDYQSWAMLGELRAHTSGTVQLTAGLGVGFASALVSPGVGDSVNARLHRTEPYVLGDLGARVTISKFWLGLSVGGSPSTPGFMATLSIGWSPMETRRD
jgi:hypothetical protein